MYLLSVKQYTCWVLRRFKERIQISGLSTQRIYNLVGETRKLQYEIEWNKCRIQHPIVCWRKEWNCSKGQGKRHPGLSAPSLPSWALLCITKSGTLRMVFLRLLCFHGSCCSLCSAMTGIWLDLESRRKAEGVFPLPFWSSCVGFLDMSFHSGLGAPQSASCFICLRAVEACVSCSFQQVPDCLEAALLLNIHPLIKGGILRCHVLFHLWAFTYLSPPICHLICPSSHLFCILFILRVQQLVCDDCISSSQSIFFGWIDEGMNERKGEVTGLGRSINGMGGGDLSRDGRIRRGDKAE